MHVSITAGLFAAILGLAIVGNAVETSGSMPTTPAARLTAMITFGILTAGLAFSAVPVIVKLVLGAQVRTHPGAPVLGVLVRRERAIILVLWAIMGLGLITAVPAAIFGGAFD